MSADADPLTPLVETLEVSPASRSLPLVGIVLAVQANYYWVQLDGERTAQSGSQSDRQTDAHIDVLLCTRRARLKKIGQQVIVGDRVQVEEVDWVSKRGAVAQVLPRRTELDRPPVANVDQILLVFALADPIVEPLQLSRFLVKAESTGLTVKLCFNKSDLISPEERQNWSDRLHHWGYAPVAVSVRGNQGLDAIQAQLAHRITVVSGPSGVGKSSLINRLIPTLDVRVGAISGKLGRGRHTTRHVELFTLPDGGLLADTPGFNQPDLDCAPRVLASYFPEARHRLEQASCQFNDCLHRDEPNCVVRGEWERYAHYLTFLEEAIAYQTTLGRSGTVESTVKQKSRQEGQIETEPKLATKKYRRPSRRTEKQALEDLYQDAKLLTEEEN
ncbi:MAG: small ribosomal subunit biogenesis GTPase RsgA [Oculatellaceae cyanobacterium bins.114]|nr:small ribosomal subunit biogenesis GTPase RsgA [Oculatellaceae cyanobacterium bins.114]